MLRMTSDSSAEYLAFAISIYSWISYYSLRYGKAFAVYVFSVGVHFGASLPLVILFSVWRHKVMAANTGS